VSDERFYDLFTSLREDARINGIYLALMVLSTMLAAAGLYLNSASVIIGAMLLAPLMAPIVSLSMGILRGDIGLFRKSIAKITLGVIIALLSSVLITFLFPHQPVTDEMQARLNATLLDLAVDPFDKQFYRYRGKDSIGPDGKAQRPLCINSIHSGLSKFIVKVY
jgi:uncharacterized membrane protein